MSGICDSFSGSITGEGLAAYFDAIPQPDTLHIRMTRGERRIADELREQFGGFERVVINVDGEQHEFSADSLIRLLEDYEGARDKSRWHELFGTPERAARTLRKNGKHVPACYECLVRDECANLPEDSECPMDDYDALLEWLRGDAE